MNRTFALCALAIVVAGCQTAGSPGVVSSHPITPSDKGSKHQEIAENSPIQRYDMAVYRGGTTLIEHRDMPEEERKERDLLSSAVEKATLSKSTEDYTKARQLLEEFHKKYPDDLICLMDLAPIYSALRKPQQAYDTYRKILKPAVGTQSSMGSDSIRMTNFGEVALELGYAEEAFEAFSAAVKHGKLQSGPELPRAEVPNSGPHGIRAAAHLASGIRLSFTGMPGDTARAADEFRKALEIVPDYEGARFYLAKVLTHRDLKRDEEALQLFVELKLSQDSTIKAYATKEVDRLNNWITQKSGQK